MLPTILAATLAERPALGDSLQYQLVGILVVMGALAGLWFAITLIGAGFRLAEAGAAKAPAAPGPAGSPAGVSDGFAAPHQEGIEPEIVAVIAAAIHTTLGSGYLVSSIRQVQHVSPSDNLKLMAWSAEGRRQIFSSHRVR